MATVFDTLAFSRKLQQASFTPAQSDALADAVHEAIRGSVATKADLDHQGEMLRSDLDRQGEMLRSDLDRQGEMLRSDLDRQGEMLRSDLDRQGDALRLEMKAMETRLVVKLGTMMAGGLAIVTAILGLLISIK